MDELTRPRASAADATLASSGDKPPKSRRWSAAGSGVRTPILALALAFCCLMLAPALASAASTTEEGEIYGFVTAVGGATVEDTVVNFYSVSGEPHGSATTNPDGEYSIELPTGEYRIEFSGEVCEPGTSCTHPYVRQYYDDESEYREADIVTLEPEEETPANATLERAGAIEGEVKNAAGAAVAGTDVCASSESPSFFVECASTNAAGQYTIEGLPSASDYIVRFSGEVCPEEGECTRPYLPQYYDGSPSYSSPLTEEIEVTAPNTTEEIDATLAEGGKIAGVVTNAALSKAAITGLYVCAEPTSSTEEFNGNCAQTNSRGEYTIEGLATGAWTVEFDGEVCGEVECTKVYATQYYNGKANASEAQPVEVTAPATVPGIDASLLEAAPRQPAFLTGPTSTGTPAVGDTLSCSAGTWSNNPTSLVYAWLRNGAPIAGQTSSTYVVQTTDEGATLACEVTIANAAGSASQTSNSLAVPAKLTPPPAPVVKKGEATAAAKATVKGGKALIALTCSGGPCKGKLKLVYKIKTKVKHGKRTKAKTVKLTIGTASFTLTAGGKKTVRVKLTQKGASYLAKAGKHGIAVELSGSDVKARSLTLKTAAKAKQGKH